MQELLDWAPVGLNLVDWESLRYVWVNEWFCSMVGYTAEELIKMTVWDLTPLKWHAFEGRCIANALAFGRFGPYDKELRFKGGGLVPVTIQGVHRQVREKMFSYATVTLCRQ